jgi:hypothetical protein
LEIFKKKNLIFCFLIHKNATLLLFCPKFRALDEEAAALATVGNTFASGTTSRKSVFWKVRSRDTEFLYLNFVNNWKNWIYFENFYLNLHFFLFLLEIILFFQYRIGKATSLLARQTGRRCSARRIRNKPYILKKYNWKIKYEKIF